jgi:hypothetical protein
MAQTTLSFCFGSWPFLMLSLRRAHANCFFFFLPAPLTPITGFSLRYLVGFSDSYLVDLGAYEATTFSPATPSSIILWSLVSLNNELCFFFSPSFSGAGVSWERLYRNAWWLERELSEAYSIFFKRKHDRRSLFMVPLIYQAPFRKSYPVGGFFELSLSQHNRTLV